MKAKDIKKLMKCVLLLLLVIALCSCASNVPSGQEYSSGSTSTTINGNSKSENESDKKPVKTNNVTVKYRNTTVDITAPHFEYLDTTGSSFIRGAWYDQGNRYLVINLDGTFYHYCGMPGSVWSGFKRAESFGTYYHQNIKGKYDCRQGNVPQY